MGQKCQYLAQIASFGPNCQFWAQFGRFWAKNPIFWGEGVIILVPTYRESNEKPFLCWKHWSVRLQSAAKGENVLFWPQNLDIWGQKSIFLYSDRDFCQWSKWPLYPGLQLSHWNHPQKISVSELGVIFWGSPLFLAVLGLCQDRGAPTLNFGPISMKFGGTVRAIKKWPRRTTDPVRPELRRNGRFYVRPKSDFWPKNGSYPKNHPKWYFPP